MTLKNLKNILLYLLQHGASSSSLQLSSFKVHDIKDTDESNPFFHTLLTKQQQNTKTRQGSIAMKTVLLVTVDLTYQHMECLPFFNNDTFFL